MKQIFFIFLSMATIMGASAQNKKALVAYFSCTGTTQAVAQTLAQSIHADLYEIKPQEAYTTADLDWHDSKSRSSVEMKDAASRPALADKDADIKAYDVIFVGYPIWWYTCPTIINTFMEAYDFAGKTVIPFATSGGSGIKKSETQLQALYKQIHWQNGKLLNGSANEIAQWGKEAVK